ncbi:TonB-dependent receptor [Komagataeibacter europaeus]|uniref:TonB-dependent receptor n=1 Tax=Komagataeibacter europaeus TaxID=33995 RepID=UPI000237F0BE|nr:TonB-dependent receptor [Komagataeibacter europaeus]ARW15484.1 hypothetical protein S101446_00343 [Komagataeibacter europaeus]
MKKYGKISTIGRVAVLFTCALPTCPDAFAASVTTNEHKPKPAPGNQKGSVQAAMQPETIHVSGANAHAEHLQHVGGSIAHLSREALIQAHVTTVNDLQHVIPNLQVENAFGGGQPQFHLRGIGFFDYGSNNTPDVMTYVDGVAYPIGVMTQGVMFDLAGVDVERGPTGYTSGRSVTGGNIEMQTAEPTRTLSAGISEDIANRARSKTDLYVSGPITKRLSYRISAETIHGGAYEHNRTTGEHIGDADLGAVRARLRWEANDTTRINLSGHWGIDRSESTPGYLINSVSMPNGGIIPADSDHYATGWGMSRQFANSLRLNPNAKPFRNNQSWGIDINIQKEFSWARLTSISAYEVMYRRELNDWDGTSAADADEYFDSNLSIFSQELRLASHERGPLTWNAGLYYFKENLQDAMYSDFKDAFGFNTETRYSQPDQGFSEFASITYRPVSHMRIGFALRHENEWKELNNFFTQTSIATGPATHYDRKTGMDQVSGKAFIEYDIRPDVMAYFNIRRGVKEGGFSAYNVSAPSQLAPFKPEWLMAYEVGFKSTFFNHRLRINGAAFKYDYHDQQVQSAIEDPTIGAIGKIINAPRSSLWGVELEAQAEPVRGLHLTQNFGYEQGQYEQFQALNIAASQATGASGNGYQTINKNMQGKDMGFPKLQLSGSASYDIRLPGALRGYILTPEADYSYRSEEYAVILGPLYNIKPYFLLNTSLTFRPKNGKWSVTGYVQNALNRTYDMTRNFFTTSNFGIVGPPRFYGARISYTY